MNDVDTSGYEYDGLLVLSFGGPEGNEEVVPFLENVTRGRGIPRERLEEVGEHYFHFDGISPINRLNLEIIDNLKAELLRRGISLPVYFGNRNWHPFAGDTAKEMSEAGIEKALVFATSAWGGYSACRQYNEDIVGMREALAADGFGQIEFVKLRQFFDHPKFVEEMARGITDAQARIPAAVRSTMRLIFTAHSVPSAHDAVGGRAEDKNLYSRQVAEASRLVAESAGFKAYDLVWQSRSGSPKTPWLEPDIVDHVKNLAQTSELSAVLVCPIGFISDHMEVIWDLDSELKQATDELGIHYERSRTVGPTQAFSSLLVDLVEEHLVGRRPESLGEVTVQGCTVNGAPCAEGCCDIWSLRKAH